MADAKQGKAPIEDFCNGSSQARVVLAKPRLGAFGSSGFASSSSKGCNPFSSVLRPSQLKPSSNPFLKVSEPENAEPRKEKEEEAPTEDRLKETKEEEEAPKFVPLGSANATSRTSKPAANPQPAPSTSSTGFVFGQNLSERVVIQENLNNGEAAADDHSSTNGTSELLFTNAAASVKDNAQEESGPSEASSSTSGEGLAAAAAEYERSHARPPLPTANYNLTGEEDETNVLQISCRLFAWESGGWRERGRGVLRLNDAMSSSGASRLVARVAGSLRVVLNTKLWPDMIVERAGTKSLRITATDAQQLVKLFLVMGAPSDIVQLHRAITSRIAVSKRHTASTCAQNVTSQQAAERLEASVDDTEFLDKASDPDEKQDSEDGSSMPSTKLTNDNTNKLKRKETDEEETAVKRQCSDVTE